MIKYGRSAFLSMLVFVLIAAIGARADDRTAVSGQKSGFIRESSQSVHDFLLKSAPEGGPKITNFTPAPMKLSGREMLIAVYEGGFDGSGASAPAGSDGTNRQFAFAFVAKPGEKNSYIRFPVTGFYDDGGSLIEVLAAFQARFDSVGDSKLAFLTKWDSTRAGGESAMERSGLFYQVTAFNFDPSSGFSEFKSPALEKLGGCDCKVFDGKGKLVRKEKSQAKDVAGIKKQLASMGISQATSR